MRYFGGEADKMLELLIRADEHWFLSNLLKWYK